MMTAAASLAWRIATSRIGIAAIAATLSYGVAYHRGYSRADRQAEITALQSDLAIARADIDAARRAEALAAQQAESLAAAANRYLGQVDDLEAELSQRPERAACRISDADRRRLLDIDAGEGGAAARSAPLAIVPPARNGAAPAGR